MNEEDQEDEEDEDDIDDGKSVKTLVTLEKNSITNDDEERERTDFEDLNYKSPLNK